MKAIKFLRAAIVLVVLILGACAPSATSLTPVNVGGGKSVSEVVFTGTIESMDGDQWVINGQTIQVDASVLRDGSFKVGDSIKVEAAVAADGSVIAQRVEMPSAADLVEVSTSTPEDSSSPDASSTSVAGSASQPLTFDNSGTEAVGSVDAITDTSITIGGQTFPLASGVEIKGEIVPGAIVKLHFTVNADGTLSVTEIEIADPSQTGVNDNSNDDNSNDSNINDDNSNDDNGNDSNVNDDNGDDNGSNGNGSDDNGNHDSNDDHGNDGGSDDNGGSDDHGGDSNDSNDD